jgi:hypothetical protein
MKKNALIFSLELKSIDMPKKKRIQNPEFTSGIFPSNLQLHKLQVSGDLEGGSGLAADLLDGDTLSVLDQSQTLGGADVEDGQVGDNGRDTAGAGQGESAVGKNLGVTLLVGVFL